MTPNISPLDVLLKCKETYKNNTKGEIYMEVEYGSKAVAGSGLGLGRL